MTMPNRRSFLGGIGAGMFAAHASTSSMASRAIDAPPADINELVKRVRATPHDELLQKALEWHSSGNGPDWRDLLAAAFLAGIRDVEPRPVGFQFHCVMMTASAFSIASRAPEPERLAAALFNLDDFKRSQTRDARGGDWMMKAAPTTTVVDVTAATSVITEVFETWDLDNADQAGTALAHCASLDEAFEPLWWYALRDFTNIGHHPIFVAQTHRTLQHIGWRYGRDVMRSLVYGLLDGKPGAADQTFVANQERAARLVLPTTASKAKASVENIVAQLHTGTPESASEAAAAALANGLPLDALWDALRLFAVEQSWRDPGLLTAHSLTSINALRYITDKATAAHVRSMAVLQAVSYQVLYRDFLSSRDSYNKTVDGIASLKPAATAKDAQAVFVAAGDNARAAAPLAIATAHNQMAELMTATRHWLVRKPRDAHDYKFAAALLEEMHAASPATARTMLAASLGYLRKPADRDHKLWAMVTSR